MKEKERKKESLIICAPGMNKMGEESGERPVAWGQAGVHVGGYLKDFFEDKHGK